MSKKSLFSILAIIVILIVGGIVYAQSTSNQSTEKSQEQTSDETIIEKDSEVDKMMEEKTKEPESMSKDSSKEMVSKGEFSDENTVTDSGVQVFKISYDGKAYSPSAVNIKNGDIVIFQNNSDQKFWPASAPHPQHTNYPEFDAKAGLAPGAKFEFKFTKTGKWGFHDHLSPSIFGSVTVE